MPFNRKLISVSVTWGMVALMLWGSFPSTICICANGVLKLYCGSLPHERNRSEVSTVGECCATVRDCKPMARENESGPSRNQLTNPGCTRVSRPPSVATVPVSSTDKLDIGSAFSVLPPELTPRFATASSSPVLQRNTGPPLDLVIKLHCLLI